MFVLIAGGGRTASQLANQLLGENHQVRVIEGRADVLAHLHRELPTEAILVGEATHSHVLERAGIREAQVLAACMPRDADNLVLCFLARTRYEVPRTIAQVNNPRNAWLFDERFHVDVALNESEILSRLIEEEMSMGDMMTLLKLRRGQYSVVEEKVPPGAQAVGKTIQELKLSDRCTIAAIIRKGEMVIPRGATVLEQGDEVLAITDRKGAEGLAALLAPPPTSNPRRPARPESG